MENLARKLKDERPVLEYGEALGRTEERCVVRVAGAEIEADRAVSCLVRPEEGDTVLVSLDPSGRAYVLSVLERPGGAAAPKTLEIEGETRLRVRGGGLVVSADGAASLASGEKVSLAAPILEMDASEGRARIESFSFFGRFVDARVEGLRTLARTVDSVFGRVVERLTSSYRYVEEHEEVQSASTRLLVEGTLTMQTRNTMHTAEEHVKIDAEQIHLG